MHRNILLSLPVLLGGALGALCRFHGNAAIMAEMGGHFPLGILCINMAGSFIMGLLMGTLARMGQNCPAAPWLNAFLGTGFLGGFTTFSTFADDMFLMAKGNNWLPLVAYVAVSLVVGFVLYKKFDKDTAKEERKEVTV